MANEELLQKLRRQPHPQVCSVLERRNVSVKIRRLRMGEDPLPVPTRQLDHTKERLGPVVR